MLHRECSHPAAGSSKLESCSLEQNTLYDSICGAVALFLLASYTDKTLSLELSFAFSFVAFPRHSSFHWL